MKGGHEFESETDTEAVAKLLKHVFDLHRDNSLGFTELVAQVIQPLVSFHNIIIYFTFRACACVDFLNLKY